MERFTAEQATKLLREFETQARKNIIIDKEFTESNYLDAHIVAWRNPTTLAFEYELTFMLSGEKTKLTGQYENYSALTSRLNSNLNTIIANEIIKEIQMDMIKTIKENLLNYL